MNESNNALFDLKAICSTALPAPNISIKSNLEPARKRPPGPRRESRAPTSQHRPAALVAFHTVHRKSPSELSDTPVHLHPDRRHAAGRGPRSRHRSPPRPVPWTDPSPSPDLVEPEPIWAALLAGRGQSVHAPPVRGRGQGPQEHARQVACRRRNRQVSSTIMFLVSRSRATPGPELPTRVPGARAAGRRPRRLPGVVPSAQAPPPAAGIIRSIRVGRRIVRFGPPARPTERDPNPRLGSSDSERLPALAGRRPPTDICSLQGTGGGGGARARRAIRLRSGPKLRAGRAAADCCGGGGGDV